MPLKCYRVNLVREGPEIRQRRYVRLTRKQDLECYVTMIKTNPSVTRKVTFSIYELVQSW